MSTFTDVAIVTLVAGAVACVNILAVLALAMAKKREVDHRDSGHNRRSHTVEKLNDTLSTYKCRHCGCNRALPPEK